MRCLKGSVVAGSGMRNLWGVRVLRNRERNVLWQHTAERRFVSVEMGVSRVSRAQVPFFAMGMSYSG